LRRVEVNQNALLVKDVVLELRPESEIERDGGQFHVVVVPQFTAWGCLNRFGLVAECLQDFLFRHTKVNRVGFSGWLGQAVVARASRSHERNQGCRKQWLLHAPVLIAVLHPVNRIPKPPALVLRCPRHISDFWLCLETGKRNVSADNLLSIAQALSVTLDFLMKGDSSKPKSGEVKIPASLVEFAKQEHLSFPHTLMLLEMRLQIKAHRSNSKSDDLEIFDWKPFYEAVKSFLK